jgi:aspartyl-tRNA(Asn)/glutamyl-tRNA(Gln) amidotransferase subunit B
MPELPHQARLRLQSQYGLNARDVEVLMSVNSGVDVGFDGEPGSQGSAVQYFEEVSKGRDPKVVVNW